MSKQQAVKTTQPGKKKPAVNPVVQEALQVTWLLKGHLKNVQIAYIRVGVLLARVRDEKMYSALDHPDIETYAEERLHLGRSSLYRYLQVYDWMQEFHKEWLQPKPKGFIPELADAGDLMWIERELTRKDLAPKERADLEALRAKALDGRLRDPDLNRWRQQARGNETGVKSFLSKLRLLRTRGAQLASMPPEVIAHLDAAIGLLKNAVPLQQAGLATRKP